MTAPLALILASLTTLGGFHFFLGAGSKARKKFQACIESEGGVASPRARVDHGDGNANFALVSSLEETLNLALARVVQERIRLAPATKVSDNARNDQDDNHEVSTQAVEESG